MQASSDQRKDVEAYIQAIIHEASQQADLVLAFLNYLQHLPALQERLCKAVPLSQDLLLKLSAWIRISQWEKTGLRPSLRASLPSARAVLEDLLGLPPRTKPRFSGNALAAAVLQTYLSQLAWKGLTGLQADVAIAQTLPSEQALDVLAQFLWQFRHLTTKECQP